MSQEELIHFIKNKCRSGYPSGELKLDLMGKGYKEADIEAAFYSISKEDNFNTPLWYLVSILFIVFGVYQVTQGNKVGFGSFTWGCVSLVIKLLMSYKKESL
ncbi:MAG: hypothetical protein ACXWV9_09340 [Flavisolibacter sp.]